MKLVILALLALGLCACRTAVITRLGSFENIVHATIADPRNSAAQATIDVDGSQLWIEKNPASPQFMSMIERTAPDLAKALAEAVISQGASTVTDVLAGLVPKADEKAASCEVPSETALEEMPPGMRERERKRRSAEEKEAARRARAAAEAAAAAGGEHP